MIPGRRKVLLATLAAALPRPILSSVKARVVIVGGGFGGAACARTLKTLSPDIDVRLLEPRPSFYTGMYCNTAISGLSELGDVVQSPGALSQLGVEWIHDQAREIDPVTRSIRLASGTSLSADFIVVSPGISIDASRIDGYSAAGANAFAHAWQGDEQVRRMRQQLDALHDGATILIAAPPDPYRCPPGPYERASLMAWRMASTGRRCKILIADSKDDFTKRGLFQLGWDTLYPGRIEWISRASGGDVVAVDAARRSLRLANGEILRPDLACIVPVQRAGQIAIRSGLTDASGWCPVHPQDFESSLHRDVYVIGDASAAHPMPKSAFCAIGHGRQAAIAIAARVRGDSIPDPTFLNTCYSLLAPDYAISVSSVYGVTDDRIATLSSGTSPLSGSRELRSREARYAHALYAQITRDTFGS